MRFRHRRPDDHALHQAVFECPVEFNCPHTEILFERRILDLHAKGNLKFFKPLLGFYIQHRIAQLPVYDQSMSTVVALAIPSIIGTGKCDLEFIASSLDMSAKKLQRLLADEGTTFSDILDHVREEMARHLLANSDASVERIAGLLDYASNAPFTNAFKRWTDQTPMAFRRQEQQH